MYCTKNLKKGRIAARFIAVNKLNQRTCMINVTNTYNMLFTKYNKVSRLRFAKSLKKLGRSLEKLIKKYG